MVTRSSTTVAIVSRHFLLPEQKQSLIAAGFHDFVQVVLPPARQALTGARFRSSDEVWRTICFACDGAPGLVVAVLPLVMLGQLAVHAAHRNVTVLRALMVEKNGDWLWTGSWQHIKGFQLLVKEWTAQSEREAL